MNYRNYPNYQQQPPQQQIPAQYQQQYQQQPFPPQYPQLPPQRKKKLPQWARYVLYVVGGILMIRLIGAAVGAHPAEPTPVPNMETLVAQARLFMEATDTVVALSAISTATATIIPSDTPVVNVRGSVQQDPTATRACVIKGNRDSKIYHCLNSQYYDGLTENIRWFCSPEEAEAAGFRAPENQRGCRY